MVARVSVHPVTEEGKKSFGFAHNPKMKSLQEKELEEMSALENK